MKAPTGLVARSGLLGAGAGAPGLAVVFAVAFVTGLSGAVMPGPLLVITVQRALLQGVIAGPLLMIGHGALELAAAALLTLGLIRFAKLPLISGAIGLLGGLILLALAYLTLAGSGRAGAEAVSSALAASQAGASPGLRSLHGEWARTVALGALMSLANPYWWLWWATIGASHIAWASARGAAARSFYFAGHLLSDVGWYTVVALIVGEGKALLLLRPAAFRALFLICGVALLGLGVLFLRWGLLHLLRRARDADPGRVEPDHAPTVH